MHPFMKFRLGAAVVALVIAFTQTALAQNGATDGQWHFYGGDSGSTKYSPLDQINRDNVGKLKILWTWDAPDEARAMYEVTPLVVGGVMYANSTSGHVAAIDPKTGETKWVFDTEASKSGRSTNLGALRGVAYWTDGQQERILIATPDSWLWAIDARSGQPISEFGDGGKVDLAAAIPLARRARTYAMSSPPVICRDRVIVGSSITDGPSRKEAPRGDIQAFDVRTGKPAWIFHTVPQAGEFGNDTWEDGAWEYTGNTNAWSLLSADEELGYVYIPTGTPTNDWYGGHRLGDNLFAESIICLNATTGERVWHFQTVHHGLWDYDLPSAPVLCDITVEGKPIKAVVQPTKTGFLFVFDRTNGKPVWPIEERPVPQSKVPGERTSPTQPFPTRPAPFELQGAVEENLIDFTPELRAEAKQLLDKFEHGPIFTPPTEQGTLQLPGWTGGCNFWGAAFDPETGMLYVPSVSNPISVGLSKPDAARSNFNYVRGRAPGTEGPRGLPSLFKPPYGKITAIDMNTGEHRWVVPQGDGRRKQVSEIVGFDVGPLGSGGVGPVLTKTLLIVGQLRQGRGPRSGAPADVLMAHDKKDGSVLATIPLPAPPNGTPMTYMAGGKQYIAVALSGNKIVAFGLPD